MNPTFWSLEEGHLLQSLRIKANVDAHVFARKNTISLAQLRELESGEGQSFYNESIKRHTGVKLLKKLGYEFPTSAIEVTTPITEALLADPAHDTNSVVSIAGTANAKKPSIPKPVLRHPIVLMGGLLMVGLVGFMGFQGQNPWPSVRQQPVAEQRENAQPQSLYAYSPSTVIEAPTALTPRSSNQATQSAQIPDSRVLSLALAPESSKVATVSCEEPHRHISASHTPSNPLKPGNYIHIEARTDSQLCVLDSQNKLSFFTLKAGMNQTVNGVAPFLLHASNWQGLQVFFQGRPVQVEHSDNPRLVLNSVPL